MKENIKAIAILLTVNAWIESTVAVNYYVDHVNGCDSNLGTTPQQAWQMLEKVNSIVFEPGDIETTGTLSPRQSSYVILYLSFPKTKFQAVTGLLHPVLDTYSRLTA